MDPQRIFEIFANQERPLSPPGSQIVSHRPTLSDLCIERPPLSGITPKVLITRWHGIGRGDIAPAPARLASGMDGLPYGPIVFTVEPRRISVNGRGIGVTGAIADGCAGPDMDAIRASSE